MLERADVLKIIDDGYKARARGDKKALKKFWAPGARYHQVGDKSLVRSFPAGPGGALKSVEKIMDLVKFKNHKRLDAVVEGNKAAVRTRITASFMGGRPVKTELYDLWEINDAGKVVSLTQFTDTALLAKVMNASRSKSKK